MVQELFQKAEVCKLQNLIQADSAPLVLNKELGTRPQPQTALGGLATKQGSYPKMKYCRYKLRTIAYFYTSMDAVKGVR